MQLSKRWLLDHVDLDVSDKDFIDKMTMSGSIVNSVEAEGADIKNVVVAEVLTLDRHPDSDHLWVTTVDVGAGAPVQIVTGAQNLKVGDFVPAALDDSYVAGGKHIKSGKLRGVQSDGMLCSLGELGLTAHDFPYAIEDGIFVLGDDCDLVPGEDIHKAIGLDDSVADLEITGNRPDCLSVIGLAREAAATFDREFKTSYPEVECKAGGDVNDILRVSIEAPDKCFRYIGAVVKNVKIEPSPRWMRERLRAMGVRPINNIVDITNFVMLEYGQPMHAFDLRYLEGGQVVVRNARAGETITTLDGIERPLADDMLVICDEKKPVAVAGVMGGEYSGVMDDTTTIVFESACFDGFSVRSAAKRLGMRTESSSRFEKGLDPAGCIVSQLRALQLVEQLGAGEVVSGLVDVFPSPRPQVVLPFDPQWVNNFIGIDVSADEQKAILEKLGFKVSDGNIYSPYFRIDIEHQADISEEIARFYGYQNIPDRALSGVAVAALTDRQKYEKFVRDLMISCGLTQIETFTFISPSAYEKIRLPEDKRASVVITNPLGEDTGVMRTNALPSMMSILAGNYNHRNLEASLFELATEFIPLGGPDVLPLEQTSVVLGMYGENVDFYTLKGVVEELFIKSGVTEYDVRAVSDDPTFHPGRTAAMVVNGEDIAVLGEVHPAVAANYGIGVRVYAARISFDRLCELKNTEIEYAPLPKFPALSRDISFVIDRFTPVLYLSRLIKKAGGKSLESVRLFDVYQGGNIAADKKSVAFSLRFRGDGRTLTDEEADRAMADIVSALSSAGAVIRDK